MLALLLLFAPLLALLGAALRAVVLFWPVMLTLGALHHDFASWVPAASWWQSMLIVMIFGLLIPSDNVSTNS